MARFLAMYMAPAATIAEWMKKPEEERKAADQKMMADWNAWMAAHAAMIKETNEAGKSKRVSKDGILDAANDLMLYSIVEGESQDAVAQVFASHPHLGIPGATIEVMPMRPI